MSTERTGQSNIIAIAKIVAANGGPAIFRKSDYWSAIKVRAEEIRQPGQSPQQATTAAITRDEIGITLYKAMKFAKGPEVEGDDRQDDVRSKQPAPIGPAHAKMQALADDHLRKHPELAERRGTKDGGKAAAFARVYTAPANEALRQEVKNEHMQHMLSQVR